MSKKRGRGKKDDEEEGLIEEPDAPNPVKRMNSNNDGGSSNNNNNGNTPRFERSDSRNDSRGGNGGGGRGMNGRIERNDSRNDSRGGNSSGGRGMNDRKNSNNNDYRNLNRSPRDTLPPPQLNVPRDYDKRHGGGGNLSVRSSGGGTRDRGTPRVPGGRNKIAAPLPTMDLLSRNREMGNNGGKKLMFSRRAPNGSNGGFKGGRESGGRGGAIRGMPPRSSIVGSRGPQNKRETKAPKKKDVITDIDVFNFVQLRGMLLDYNLTMSMFELGVRPKPEAVVIPRPKPEPVPALDRRDSERDRDSRRGGPPPLDRRDSRRGDDRDRDRGDHGGGYRSRGDNMPPRSQSEQGGYRQDRKIVLERSASDGRRGGYRGGDRGDREAYRGEAGYRGGERGERERRY